MRDERKETGVNTGGARDRETQRESLRQKQVPTQSERKKEVEG